jgi:hypothetical protein
MRLSAPVKIERAIPRISAGDGAAGTHIPPRRSLQGHEGRNQLQRLAKVSPAVQDKENLDSAPARGERRWKCIPPLLGVIVAGHAMRQLSQGIT